MNLTNFLLRELILPTGDLLFGQRMISRLKYLEKAQWWSAEDILNYQNRELSKLLTVSYNEVPFYRNLFDTSRIRLEDIQNPSDLSKLPIVTKKMLRNAYPHQTTRPTGQKTYVTSTSGSTGENFYVREDAYTAGWYRASFLLALEWSGWSIGDPHLQTGMTLNRSLDRQLKDWVLRCFYVSAYNLNDENLERILSTIEQHKLQYLWGYPGSLFFLAQYANKHGWNQPLKSAVTWGDMLYPNYRKTIEATFRTKVFDTYGCAEGIQISAQCEHGNYHLHAYDTIVEFVDEEGRSVSPENIGNIIVTRLHPGPMPLIRYAVGDLGIANQPDTCPCGRNLPTMKGILGRNADIIETPSGNRLIVHYFTGILENFQSIITFQVIQNSISEIEVKIVSSKAPTKELEYQIIHALQAKGAADLIINISFVDQIPVHQTGKHKFIIRNM